MADYIKFPFSYRSGVSEGQARFDEFERLLFHNWNTSLANPTLWFVMIDSIPRGLRYMDSSNIINKEGPNQYDQLANNQENIFTMMTNRIGCMIVHGVDLPMIQVDAGRAKTTMGGYYGGLVDNEIEEQNTLQLEIRETQSSVTDFLIRPWIELVAKNGFVARPAGDDRYCKCRITIVQLGVAGPGTDPIKRKIWQFYDAAPSSVANNRLAHDGTWSANDQFINTSWVYSHYKMTDVRFENVSEVYKAHVEYGGIRPQTGQRTSGRIGSSDGPVGDIVVV